MSLDVNMSEPDEFNCIELHSSIQDVAKMKGMEDFEYHVDYLYGKGDNYIANIFKVTIKETGKEDNKSVIVKTLVNTTRQELFHELHKREVLVYKEVIKKFKTLQDDLDDKDRINLPECLLSREEKGQEILILDDLLANGFAMDDKLAKFEKLDYLQVRLVLTELAKFHGLSFVFEQNDPKKFEAVKVMFDDILFKDSFLNKSKLRNYFFESFEESLKVVNDLEAKKKLGIVQEKLLNVLKKYTQPRKYNVLCHGDCWINNILFKHQNTKPSQVCFLDFQAMRYASPATDIVFFLYLCTDSNFRFEYLETLETVYYDSLEHYLNLFNIDANIVYPKEDFFKDIQEILPFGLVIALTELRITTANLENDETGSKIAPVDGGGQNLFIIRVNNVVQESVENGVLDKLVNEINI